MTIEKKISELLPALTSVDDADLLVAVDTSAGTTNQVTFANLQASVSRSALLSSDAGNLLEIGTDSDILLDSGSLISTDASNTMTAGTDGKLYVSPGSIPDASITVAKLANGTDGELITWDASGVAATVAAGTAGQVLTSNGAGAAPTFQSIASGGIELISTATASASASISFTGLSATHTYILDISGVRCSAASAELDLQASTNNGSTYDTTNANYSQDNGFSSFSGYTADISPAAGMQLTGQTGLSRGISNTASYAYSATVIIFAQTSGNYKLFKCESSYRNQGGVQISCRNGCQYIGSTSNVNAIKIVPNSGTITVGEFRLYRLANA